MQPCKYNCYIIIFFQERLVSKLYAIHLTQFGDSLEIYVIFWVFRLTCLETHNSTQWQSFETIARSFAVTLSITYESVKQYGLKADSAPLIWKIKVRIAVLNSTQSVYGKQKEAAPLQKRQIAATQSGVYGNAANSFYISLEGDKYSICRLTFGSCPSEATNRAPRKIEIQFRTAPIPQAHRRLMPALPKCPRSYWISGPPHQPHLALFFTLPPVVKKYEWCIKGV